MGPKKSYILNVIFRKNLFHTATHVTVEESNILLIRLLAKRYCKVFNLRNQNVP